MTHWLIILLGALIALQGVPVVAQGVCGDRADMVSRLAENYDEVRRGFGIANGIIVEVWASSATGTFTILQSYTTGVACVVASGRNWQDEDWKEAELQKEPKT